MFAVLRNSVYAKLFGAQIIALLGTGLLTIALGLLAFDIGGGEAGLIMGIAMTVKMIAYVAVAPILSALAARMPRKQLLISADIVRAGVALCLPFVTEAWHIYTLIFLLQSASAAFTPAFQATIPSVFPDERQYIRALSLSRLAYDLESLVSPMIAAALLTLISYQNLFVGTVFGFIGSASLIAITKFPAVLASSNASFVHRLTSGTRMFWARPDLRALTALNLVVASTTAMVIVNSVVLVKVDLDRPQADLAILLAAYGSGSMIVALSIPHLLDRFSDRKVMLCGASLLPIVLLIGAGILKWVSGPALWIAVVLVWLVLGAATSTILTPSSRLLQRNSSEENRTAIFTAQFSLSHACYLITYPLAGFLGATVGLPATALVLVALAVVGTTLAFSSWRSIDPQPARPAEPSKLFLK